uniref:UMP kinase n=1 Tax=Araucaria cunninghamii TaxID=56994 RepID=A0A0D6R6P9_ARACU
MACEEDFVMLDAAHQAAHHHHHPQAFAAAAAAAQFHPNAKPLPPHAHGHIDPHALNSVESRKKCPGEEEDYSDAAFCSQGDPKCPPDFPPEMGGHHHHHDCFGDDGFRTGEDEAAKRGAGPGPGGGGGGASRSRSRPAQGKRKDTSREELSDGGTYYHGKSTKRSSGGVDQKKDREEWSDTAIGCLLDAYTEKYVQLNRGNLRGRDWEEVALIVSERCDRQKSAKSIEQCKNKVDNLKKRYKSERHRLSSGASTVSHWPWYKKMDQIVGTSVGKAVSDEDKSMGAAGSMNIARPTKRFASVTPSPVGLSNNLKIKTLPIPRWHRVLLKISGTALAGNAQNVDPKVTMLIAREIAAVNRLGVEVAIIVGGRNFFCGSSWVGSTGLDRAAADQIGMMATIMNSLILQASIENLGIQTRVLTAFKMTEIAEPYIRRRAIRHLEKGRVVIFGGGSGTPFFSTDSAAAVRASEIHAEVVLKGTNVDGVYDNDPRLYPDASLLDFITYRDVTSRDLSVMDLTAITLCQENNIPVVVFNLNKPGNITRALRGERVGTLIDHAENLLSVQI